MATEELALSILTRPNPRDGDFERIMGHHERMVVSTAYRLLGRMDDARDAAQEVFLRLLKHLDRIHGDPKPWPVAMEYAILPGSKRNGIVPRARAGWLRM